MSLTYKQIYDVNHMNVAAQNVQLGKLLNEIIDQTANEIDDTSARDLTLMNVAAQNVKLGNLINDIIQQNGAALTDKQIYDLNNMNVASQNIQLGTLLQDMMDADNYVEGGKLNPFNSIEDYIAGSAAFAGKDVYVMMDSMVKQDYSADLTTNDANPPKLHLFITNCEFDGNGAVDMIAISNCQELVIKNCKFIDIDNNSNNVVAVNVKNIQDAIITIENCVCINAGSVSTFAISQDFANNGSIKDAVISDCYFDSTVNADINIGGAVMGDITFPVIIANNNTNFTATLNSVLQGADVHNYKLKADTIYYKPADGVFQNI